jgi:hypothetical protein
MSTRRKSVRLPRVLVYALDRRALQEFSESVGSLRGLVADLGVLVRDLNDSVAAMLKVKTPRRRPAEPTQPLGVEVPTS